MATHRGKGSLYRSTPLPSTQEVGPWGPKMLTLRYAAWNTSTYARLGGLAGTLT